MILLYNFLSLIITVLLLPLLIPLVLLKHKYRGRTLQRLGYKLSSRLKVPSLSQKPTIWIHALSVGEVTSALPLVKGLREQKPKAHLIFTTSTKTGLQVARNLIAPHVDAVLYSPFDLLFSVKKFIGTIRPDLFILVETDFWPNWLDQLRRQQVPTLLVNGRISKKSFAAYQRFSFVFTPMFRCFNLLSMQTKTDADNMIRLGISSESIATLGNLKYDTLLSSLNTNNNKGLNKTDLTLPDQGPVWICGSTHTGEEEIIFKAYITLLQSIDTLNLIIAPRDINRADDILQLATSSGLQANKRSLSLSHHLPGSILILDTIGELASCYHFAAVAFIGGSLVPQGGHNPIEAAAHGVPVLFGPHMEDFQEITEELAASGGARTVTSAQSLAGEVLEILTDKKHRSLMSGAARSLVDGNAGVVTHHLQVIEKLLHAPA